MAPLHHISQNRIAFLIFFLAIVLQSHAQFLSNIPYKGLDVSFGTRISTLQSDIAALSGLDVTQEGGQAGVILGNDRVRMKAGIAGFFYSSNKVPRTIDLFQSELAFNVYPLMFLPNLQSRVHPYLAGGVVYDRTKFFGHYLSTDEAPINYSTSKEPYIGNTNQLRAMAGVGVEWSVLSNERDFVHLYTELKYAASMTHRASIEAFNGTVSSAQWLVNLGIRFGALNR